MPKPIKQREDWVDPELEEPELKGEIKGEKKPEPKIRISKRTGKPVRELSKLQQETLAKGRALGWQKLKEIHAGVDKERKAEALQKAKEEMRLHRDTKQQLKIASQKKAYEDALKEVTEEVTPAPVEQPPKKEKKIKKKIVKYVEASSDSDSEEEEIIVRKKKKDKPKEEDIPQQVLRQRLRNNLEEVKSNSMAQLMMPSYF